MRYFGFLSTYQSFAITLRKVLIKSHNNEGVTHSMTLKEILQVRNVRYFLMFRSSYFARFYYPVFTLLYLDYGLTLSQFAMLNVVWAATIVLAEVPSGAFADTLGRKKLVVLSSIVMFIEIAMIAFVPTGNPSLVFVVFLINRY